VTGRLRDRVAVLTGGGGFIGAAITQRFCREGAVVVVADVDTSRRDEFILQLDVPDPARIVFVDMDARDDASVRSM
jgi:NAD(P)-dependent dehydrogenase (short-subunit alcohol dehydrogenase family)